MLYAIYYPLFKAFLFSQRSFERMMDDSFFGGNVLESCVVDNN